MIFPTETMTVQFPAVVAPSLGAVGGVSKPSTVRHLRSRVNKEENRAVTMDPCWHGGMPNFRPAIHPKLHHDKVKCESLSRNDFVIGVVPDSVGGIDVGESLTGYSECVQSAGNRDQGSINGDGVQCDGIEGGLERTAVVENDISSDDSIDNWIVDDGEIWNDNVGFDGIGFHHPLIEYEADQVADDVADWELDLDQIIDL